MSLVGLVLSCAKIPSFSTYEERLHPFIIDYLSEKKGVKLKKLKDNNIVVFCEGKTGAKPVVITSHLDKINHYGEVFPEELEASLIEGEIHGQMDNAVGVGMCLYLIDLALKNEYPPLIFLFSEMEESSGLKNHPHLLKNNGKDVSPQIGAWRLSEFLASEGIEPACFITIDTTPVFKGEPGVALYTEYWERKQIKPEADLTDKLDKIRSFVLSVDENVRLANGTNDYLVYGEFFGTKDRGCVPSIAIEPAIYPYHQIGEGVFVKDLERIVAIIKRMLSEFDFSYK